MADQGDLSSAVRVQGAGDAAHRAGMMLQGAAETEVADIGNHPAGRQQRLLQASHQGAAATKAVQQHDGTLAAGGGGHRASGIQAGLQ
jgi:hypothetical protein